MRDWSATCAARPALTVLVHECYLKLLAAKRLAPTDRNHFLAYAATAMRSVIVDTVRAAGRERRGGDALHVTLATGVADLAGLPEEEILDVDAALADLARLDPRLARVVEMRYFAGMTDQEIADAHIRRHRPHGAPQLGEGAPAAGLRAARLRSNRGLVGAGVHAQVASP